jgi:UDPglucose--hexose-1-phosphate uridylyltransferase
MPEFRKDPVTGRWVIISSQRAKRPQAGLGHSSAQPEVCPFCAGNERETPPEVLAYRNDKSRPDRPGWSLRVVPNKYPALVAQSGEADCTDGFYEARAGVGVHEVVIESPEHVISTGSLDERQLTAVLRAYRDRMLRLGSDKRWRYILVYKNEGREAGATLEHVHSQVMALPHVPKEVADEIDGARRYYQQSSRCLYCTIVENERSERTRLVSESERFIVLCPYAPRFPFETWILPKTHEAVFERGSDDEYAEFSRCLRDTLKRLHRGLEKLPFNYVIHSAPVSGNTRRYYHWHMEIMPKLSQAAGFEWGSGSFINPIAPEEAARLLRGLASSV